MKENTFIVMLVVVSVTTHNHVVNHKSPIPIFIYTTDIYLSKNFKIGSEFNDDCASKLRTYTYNNISNGFSPRVISRRTNVSKFLTFP